MMSWGYSVKDLGDCSSCCLSSTLLTYDLMFISSDESVLEVLGKFLFSLPQFISFLLLWSHPGMFESLL